MTVLDDFWKHHCIESTYGVDHGELYLHKDVEQCSACGKLQKENA